MRANKYCAIVVVATTVIIQGIRTTKAADDALKTLQDKFWDWQMRTNPESSTWQGWHKYNDLSYSYNISNFNTSRVSILTFLSELQAVDRGQLDKSGQVNYDILNDSLTTFLDGNQWAMYGSLSPINFLGGLHLQWCPPFDSESRTRGDFENYITRLNAAKLQVDEIIESGRTAIELNRTLHNVSIRQVPGQIDANIFNTTEESPCYNYLQSLLNQSSINNETEREYIRDRARSAVDVYMEAFKTLKDFIENEYMPASRSEYGVYGWDPSGEHYKTCISWYLSFEMTPEDVHNTGVKEVDRISGHMIKIMRGLGFNGTVGEFFRSIEGDQRFYTDDKVKILEDYRKVVFERINPKLPTMFKKIPDVPLEVVSSSSDGIGGGYSSASETRPGRFIINLFRPMEVPSFEMMALSLHEASPGHHLQHSYSMFADLPDFRKDALLAFSAIPNWIPYYSAYSEGWALYSEYLGEEMGLYKDEYEMMGRYSYEIMRACRLVVDTGIHHFKWDRARAIDYMMNYTALGQGSAEGEIDRYITWPGQALSYKLGEIKVKDLRVKATTELEYPDKYIYFKEPKGSIEKKSDKFDIKEFHLLLLENGGMPMRMVEAAVNDWIKLVQNTMTSSARPNAIVQSAILLVLLNILLLLIYR